MRHVRRSTILFLASFVGVASWAPAAHAWTASIPDNLLISMPTFSAESAETNSLTVTRAGNVITFADPSDATPTAGTGCAVVAASTVACTVAVIPSNFTVMVSLGDGDDQVDASALDSTTRGNLMGDAGRDMLIGGAAPDILVGGDGDDTLRGGGGDDFFSETDAGNDVVHGDAGDDSVSDSPGDDTYHGGDGADRFQDPTGTGNDRYLGDAGDDTFDDGPGADAYLGGAGDDRFSFISNPKQKGSDGQVDTISGGAGTDDVWYGSAPARKITVTIGSGARNDGLTGSNDTVGGDVENISPTGTGGVNGTPVTSPLAAFITGNGLANTFYGTDGADVLSGGAGNDDLSGGAGKDRLIGGPGVDKLDGGAGNDTLLVRDGKRDTVKCGTGRDTVTADRFDSVAKNCEVVVRR